MLFADTTELRLWGDRVRAEWQAEARLPLSEAAAGDDEAFGRVMQRMMPLIQSLTRQYACPGVVEQEDLAQESLVGLLAAIRTFREDAGSQFTTYAYTCIRNRLVSLCRRCGRLEREESLEDDALVPDETQVDPACLVQERDSAAWLRRTFQERLTPLEQRVLLCRLSGCTYAQTAQQLHISKKAVDNAVQRIRRKFPTAR